MGDYFTHRYSYLLNQYLEHFSMKVLSQKVFHLLILISLFFDICITAVESGTFWLLLFYMGNELREAP